MYTDFFYCVWIFVSCVFMQAYKDYSLRILLQVKQHDANDPFQCLVLTPIFARKSKVLDTTNIFRSHFSGGFLGISDHYIQILFMDFFALTSAFSPKIEETQNFKTIFSYFALRRKVDTERGRRSGKWFDCNIFIYIANYQCLRYGLCDSCVDRSRY